MLEPNQVQLLRSKLGYQLLQLFLSAGEPLRGGCCGHLGSAGTNLPVDGGGVDVCDHDVSEPSKNLHLLRLHQHGRVNSCRETAE